MPKDATPCLFRANGPSFKTGPKLDYSPVTMGSGCELGRSYIVDRGIVHRQVWLSFFSSYGRSLRNIPGHFVDIAPGPAVTRHDGAHHRMSRLMKVPGCVVTW
jgi:hypothetical protein